MDWYNYAPYQSVAERRVKAQKVADAMERRGEKLSPVNATGAKLTRTFWGKAWCDHMESLGDFATRLSKGKAYVRNGAVIDLHVLPGRFTAKVVGTEVYDVDCRVDKLSADEWAVITARCGGQISSVVELLEGKLSSSVMSVVTDAKAGLFPGPREIRLGCTCPDFAHLCKHVAAAIYGVGIRLDDEPGLLFTLRGVEAGELIAAVTDAADNVASEGGRTVAADQLADVFGIELAAPAVDAAKPAKGPAKRAAAKRRGPPQS